MSPAAMRILDANLNRAAEALRVMEDYARFGLDDAELCGSIKALRHDLAAATGEAGRRAVMWRDTPGDVGTEFKTPRELERADMSAIVTAAGKRLTEALRSIEETLKLAPTTPEPTTTTQPPTTQPSTSSPDPTTSMPRRQPRIPRPANPAVASAVVERLRYRAYEIDRRLALTLRPALFDRVKLYVLITEACCRRGWLETVELALEGGADAIQLREPDLPAGELLDRARKLVELCRGRKALCIINDRPDIALLARADGVHLGQRDLPAAEARRVIGPDMILGVSTHDLSQLRRAKLDGADYAGVGPIFPSTTKPRPELGELPGLEFAKEAAASGLLPTVAIAGITPANAASVWETGVQALAVASAVTMADDPAVAARRLLEARAGAPTP